MPCAPVASARLAADHPPESLDAIPGEVTRLIGAANDAEVEDAWTAFVAAYSVTLLRVAAAFSPGYDGALDRYAYMLDELRRHDCRRLRRFVADGRGRFSTWLIVVARRLCLDHYRRQYGRSHGPRREESGREARVVRRRLADLAGDAGDVARLEDPIATDPVDDMAASERRDALSRAMADLAPSDQLLLRLRFEQDLSARQVAILLGLPTPFHVYRRVDAVCGMLRARLDARPSSSPDNLRPVTRGRKWTGAMTPASDHGVRSA